MISTLTVSSLAYIGDGLLSIRVRLFLVEQGILQPTKLLNASNRFVSAQSQAKFMKTLLENDILTSEEVRWYKKGRNYKSRSIAKNASVISYRMATGFEVLLGYWYYSDLQSRIDEIFNLYCREVERQYGPVHLW